MQFATRLFMGLLLGLYPVLMSPAALAGAAIGTLRAVNNAQGLFMQTDNQSPSGCMDHLVNTGEIDGDCVGDADGPGNTSLVVRDDPDTPSPDLTCYPADATSVQELSNGASVFLEGAGRICLSNVRKGNVLELSWACTGQFRDGQSDPCFAEELQGFLTRDANGTHFEGRADVLVVSNIGSSGQDG